MGSSSAGMIKKLIGKNLRFFTEKELLYFFIFTFSVLLSAELTSEYAATRKQFNKSLSEFGMIQVQ